MRTTFFHAKINSIRCKTFIYALCKGGTMATSHKEKEAIIHEHFSKIMGNFWPEHAPSYGSHSTCRSLMTMTWRCRFLKRTGVRSSSLPPNMHQAHTPSGESSSIPFGQSSKRYYVSRSTILWHVWRRLTKSKLRQCSAATKERWATLAYQPSALCLQAPIQDHIVPKNEWSDTSPMYL